MSLRSYVRDFCDPEAPLYVSQRYKHDVPECSAGKDACLIVTRVPSGWVYFCQRCDRGGMIPLDGMSVEETRRYIRARKSAPSRELKWTVQLPLDFTTEIPASGLAWLYKYGIKPDEIRRFGIGYSKREGRVILPVYDGDRLVFWQGRYTGDYEKDGVDKYRSQKAAKRDDIYFRLIRDTEDVVLVEDVLSAIKVGRVTSSVGLLYAHTPEKLIRELAKRYRTVCIWLDPGKAVQTAFKFTRCRQLGLPVRRVYSPKDPKYYGEEEIRAYLE